MDFNVCGCVVINLNGVVIACGCVVSDFDACGYVVSGV